MQLTGPALPNQLISLAMPLPAIILLHVQRSVSHNFNVHVIDIMIRIVIDLK